MSVFSFNCDYVAHLYEMYTMASAFPGGTSCRSLDGDGLCGGLDLLVPLTLSRVSSFFDFLGRGGDGSGVGASAMPGSAATSPTVAAAVGALAMAMARFG